MLNATLSNRNNASQRLMPSAHMLTTMELLACPVGELEAEVERELSENPALRLVEELRCPECRRRVRSLPCPACIGKMSTENALVFVSPRTSPSSTVTQSEYDESPIDRVQQALTLSEYVLQQVAPLVSAKQREIAVYILERLDNRGFLPETPAEVAHYLKVPVSEVQLVLEKINQADPVGVAASGVRECLQLQVRALGAEGTADPLAETILTDHFEILASADLVALARACGQPLAIVKAAVEFIQKRLSPNPARARWTHQDAGDQRFYQPDVLITRDPHRPDGPLLVEVFSAASGWLEVDPELKTMTKELHDPSQKQEWRQHLERAELFVKCMRQRNNAMRLIVTSVVQRQYNFIVGTNADYQPMTRAELAKELKYNESTISRAVADKRVQMPSGRMVRMDQFFDRSLAVRDAVREIVKSEQRALTDDQISLALKQFGYSVARRTVAKYRSMESILPANMRSRAAARVPA